MTINDQISLALALAAFLLAVGFSVNIIAGIIHRKLEARKTIYRRLNQIKDMR